MRRSLLVLTLAFAAGIATGVYISLPAGPLLIAAALVFALLFGFSRIESLRGHRDSPGWLVAGGLLLLVFLAGMAYVTVRQSSARGTVAGLISGAKVQGGEAVIEGTIIREPDVREGRAAYIVRPEAVHGSPATGLVLVADYRKDVTSPGAAAAAPEYGNRRDAPELQYGDRILARGRLQKPKPASNPGEFDYAAYLARQGIYATLSVWDGGQLQKSGPNKGGPNKSGESQGNPVVKAAIATKNRLEQVLRQTLPEPHASLLAGLLFGSTGGLPEDLQKAFRDTGVFHILPTSVTRNG